MKNRIGLLVLACLGMLLLAACVAGPNPAAHTPDPQGVVAGFWRGLWHGIISPVTFVISLFTPKIQMYAVHNNGGWYNAGFLLGVSGGLGAGFFGGRGKRWR